MNTIWSRFVQGCSTLWFTRSLRFDDMFAGQYRPLFALPDQKPLAILEIGCGPGALARALHRWYPQADITAVDRDSEFIRFAREHVPGVRFVEGDATALPFDDNTFDVTISNTVAEHIEPSAFYGEQLRVLKPGGVCLVLSSRRGITQQPACMTFTDEEQLFCQKVSQLDNTMEKYAVCRYPMSEAELPAAMTQYGFRSVSTGYAVIDLTPDDPRYPADMACAMINTARHTTLDGLDAVLHTMPEHFTAAEVETMKQMANAKYDTRIAQYRRGEKQWDATISVIMVVRGVK